MNAINGIYDNNESKLTGYSAGKVKAGVSETLYGIFHDANNGVNGEIDEGVFQGKQGDCWLISGILSLSYTDEGKEIIKNAISQNENGDYEVYFKGIDKTYTVTKDELDEANISSLKNGLGLSKSKYSTGDDDMLLIELALEKIIDEGEVPIETIDGLTGGSAYYLYQLFTDNAVGYAYGDDKDELATLLQYYEQYQDVCSATLGVEDGFSGLEDDHAYAIKSFDGSIMTLVNPWDSTKEVEVSTKDLMKNIGSYDLSVTDSSLYEDMSWEEEYYA